MLFKEKVREKFDYEVKTPDHSEIEIKRGYRDVIGKYIWDPVEHQYKFISIIQVNQLEVKEILSSLEKLNKKSELPGWLSWGMNRR